MKISISILFCCFCLITTELFSQETNNSKNPVLFTDKDFCISGDTLWFKLWFADHEKSKENIGRIQLESIDGNVISDIIVKTNEGWGQGFLFIPDSLETSQYFITAYRKSQQKLSELKLISKSLIVYNRFDNSVNHIKIASSGHLIQKKSENSGITIRSNKKKYKKREKVILDIDFDSGLQIKKALLKASLNDPLVQQHKGNYMFEYKESQIKLPDIIEQNGFLLSGKAINSKGETLKNVLVTLSIVNYPIYFDYYLTGENGEFHFFLANATGQTKIYLQTFSKKNEPVKLIVEQNCPVRLNATNENIVSFTKEQTAFAKKIIQGNYINRLFLTSIPFQPDFFEMPTPFEGEFYGTPKRRVNPANFINLENFNEISKELLFGVRMRTNDGTSTIRMVNEKSNSMFRNEPMRLLNGIPIRNNNLIEPLTSEDIHFIEMTYKRRVFGDLTFNGILSIWLNDKSNRFIAEDPNIFQYALKAIQVKKEPQYLKKRTTDISQPDIRQTYIWEFVKPDKSIQKEFFLSDFKGNVEIMVECVTDNNDIITTSKLIEVK